MRNLVMRCWLLALLVVPLATSVASAQTFTGGLRGVVKDSGGIVPGVTVTLINDDNGQARESVSNETGAYNFAAVPPGNYSVKAALTGFKTWEQKGVRIGAQQFVTIDITLDVGQLQETITVTGAAPLIDTSSASTGAVISSQQLSALPSGGRSAFLFAVTVPTVVASGDSQFNRQQDQTNASLLSLGGGTRRAGFAPVTTAQRDAAEKIDQRQQRQQSHRGIGKLRQHHKFSRDAGEHQQRQQMIGEVFGSGPGRLHHFGQQQQHAERHQHVAERDRPGGAGGQHDTGHRRVERQSRHQEDDDVADRDRDQQQRETDNRHRRSLWFRTTGREWAIVRTRTSTP